MVEIWKDVIDYEGCYQVSNQGNLRRLEFVDRGKTILPMQCKFVYYSWGNYRQVSLIKNGKGKSIPLHKLVAQCFCPNPCYKPFVNHKNGLRQDNRSENLEWVTASENTLHGKGNKVYIKQHESHRLDYI